MAHLPPSDSPIQAMTATSSTRWWPRALTLAERVAARRQPSPSDSTSKVSAAPASGDAAAVRLRRWRAQRPFDRADYLARRLQLHALDESSFEALLAEPPDVIGATEPPPRWVADVERVGALARDIAHAHVAPAVPDPDGLAPARAFVEPFVVNAMRRLHAQACVIHSSTPNTPFDPARATRLFEPSLWMLLLRRVAKVVVLELNVARVQGKLAGDTPEARCADFARQLRAGPLREQIIDEYPVLARSIITAADNWERAAGEFLTHLAADHGVISTALLGAPELGTLATIAVGAGDAHRNGRSVIIASFSSGARVVYKPRSLHVDAHFSELVRWLNDRGQTPPLCAARTVTIDGHGWAEFVDNAPCNSAEEVARFYERLGAFLAVLHALEATDFHYENVIASGEHPMLVDLEALFHPRPDLGAGVNEPEWIGWAALQASVLRAGVLPFRAHGTDESSGLDLSAVGGAGGQQTPNRLPVLVNAGTDEMRFERDFVRLPESQNRPTLGDELVNPAAYAPRILAGFTATYRLLVRHRSELLAPGGPIHRFADDPIRVVLRPTRQYALVLSESDHPDVLRDALERDRLLDRLWVAVPGRPELERVIRWEHEDLTNGDVPMFTGRPASRDLFTSHGSRLEDFFPRSGLESVVERIEAMGEEDLACQQWVIEAAFLTLVAGPNVGGEPSAPADRAPSRAPALPPGPEACVAAARRIADRLTSLALRRNGCVGWLGLTLVRDRDWTIQPVGTDLYGGGLGVAFFLAYLHHVAAHQESGTLAREIVAQSVRRTLGVLATLETAAPVPNGAIGAFGALGGAVYAFAHLGALWRDAELLDTANAIVERVHRRVHEDEDLDLIGGTAGFILAAAALEHTRPGGAVLGAIRVAANRLLARRTSNQMGTAWMTRLQSSQPLTGMSHGASGIALALLVAGDLLADEELTAVGIDALRYERGTYDPERMNWPDFRILPGWQPQASAPVMWAWCHGAPGVGLARLAALRYIRHPEAAASLTTDLALALDTTASSGFGANDSLCHGDLGNLELLVRARELGHHGEWEQALLTEAARLVDRVGRGEWSCGVPGGVETPGLMMGLAGIGYALLRLGDTAQVPSLLSLEPPRVAVASRVAP